MSHSFKQMVLSNPSQGYSDWDTESARGALAAVFEYAANQANRTNRSYHRVRIFQPKFPSILYSGDILDTLRSYNDSGWTLDLHTTCFTEADSLKRLFTYYESETPQRADLAFVAVGHTSCRYTESKDGHRFGRTYLHNRTLTDLFISIFDKSVPQATADTRRENDGAQTNDELPIPEKRFSRTLR